MFAPSHLSNALHAPTRTAALALLLLAWPLQAGTPPADGAVDKRPYHLFHPVPKEQMREFTTDRPDKTESPYTVDAGHFQIESDLVNYTFTRSGGEQDEILNVGSGNFKVGLLSNVDLQLVVAGFLHDRVEDRSTRSTTKTSGAGDLLTRLKVNFWGNDGGPTAFGMMPFVRLPTGAHGVSDNAWEGGLIFPLALSLPGEWEVGMMTECDFLRNEANKAYHAEFINSLTVGHDLVGKLAGYAEFFSSVSTQQGAGWVGTVDLGLTYKVTENVQLDGGCNIGVTPAADDWQPFVGLSMRF